VPDQASVRKISVLIVEDEASVARALKMRFDRMSGGLATVIVASTLQEAISSLETSEAFDVILWDGEPGSPAEETVKVIARFRHKSQIHVAMSGRDDVQAQLMKPGLCNESAMKPTPINNWLKDFLNSRYPKKEPT
jgi:DNA-binding NtrC family response regulator